MAREALLTEYTCGMKEKDYLTNAGYYDEADSILLYDRMDGRKSKGQKCCQHLRQCGPVLLFVLGTIAVIILGLGLSIHILQSKSDGNETVCVTKECILTAADLMQSMDTRVNPCDDFYSFSCKAWIEDTTIIDVVSDRFSALTDKMNLKLKDLLEGQDENPFLPFPEHLKKAQTFYSACMDKSRREKEGLSSFLNDIQNFGGFPALLGDDWNATNFDYIEVMREMLKRGFDNGILFSVTITKDMKNNSQEIIQLHQTTPGLSKLEYFDDNYVVEAYKIYTCVYAENLCAGMNDRCQASHADMSKDLDEAVLLELNITTMLYHSDYFANNNNIYNIMTIANLTEIANETEWLRLIKIFLPNVSGITEDTKIMVTSPDFMKTFSRFLAKVNKTPEGRRSLANYMIYRQVKETTTHLTSNMYKEYYDFQTRARPSLKVPEMWSECVTTTSAIFDLSLASQYIKQYHPEAKERKKAIEDMVNNLKIEMKRILTNTYWMDEVTKKAALKKLKYITLMAIYPEGLLNDTLLDSWYRKMNVTESHYENYVNGHLYSFDKAMEGFGAPIDKSSWKYLPSSILESNAYYSTENNSIWVPLGIAQDWFFEEKGPTYLNYGRMGFVLGHELSHAFDTTGAQLDEYGNWRDWWENDTMESFQNHSKCMKDLFDGYLVEEINATANGSLTITENIADDVGLSQAYIAFKKAIQEKPTPKLPGINLSVEQLFWVYYATIWCEKDTEQYYEMLVLTDEHPPSKLRVNSPLMNNRHFLRDFQCKPGDKMYTNKTHCHVWDVEEHNRGQ